MNVKKSFLAMAVVAIALMSLNLPGDVAGLRAQERDMQQDRASLIKMLEERPELREFMSRPLSPAWIQAKEVFAASYPRFVQAIRKGKISFEMFDSVWRDQGNRDIANAVSRYEAGELTIRRLKRQLKEILGGGAVKILSDCSLYGDVYYAGCIQGGADPFDCYVLTELFVCYCEGGGGCQ